MHKPRMHMQVRNVQLGLFSIPQTAALTLADLGKIEQHGLFGGFSPAVWLVTAAYTTRNDHIRRGMTACVCSV